MLCYVLYMNIPYTHIYVRFGYSMVVGSVHIVTLIMGQAKYRFVTLILGRRE
jgi:hypothetical protein